MVEVESTATLSFSGFYHGKSPAELGKVCNSGIYFCEIIVSQKFFFLCSNEGKGRSEYHVFLSFCMHIRSRSMKKKIVARPDVLRQTVEL